MDDIDALKLLKLVALSEAEIRNILISHVMTKEDNDISLAYRLENVAGLIHSEQQMRMCDYIMDKLKMREFPYSNMIMPDCNKEKMSEWINKYLPPLNEPVLSCGKDGSMFVMTLVYAEVGHGIVGEVLMWEDDHGDFLPLDEVVAWRMLPKPPTDTFQIEPAWGKEVEQ